MLKVYIPFAHAKNIFEIDISFFKNIGATYVLSDLDNTLDSYQTALPSPKVIELKKAYEEAGLELIIVSNNTGKRVTTYAEALGVRFFSSVGKPFARKLLRKLKEENVPVEKCVMIGDQTVTDIASSNRAKIKSILVDKLVPEDQPTTRINRLLDRPLRRKLARKNLLVDWRNR